MIILVLAFVFALVEWISEGKKHRLGVFISKPLAMILLIAWFLIFTDFFNRDQAFPLLWFLLGLLFCLGGDVFLMLPPERFFLPGLISFLLGHIFYILGFGNMLPSSGAMLPGLVIAIIVLALAITVYRLLYNGMQKAGNARMLPPVTVYAIVITIMIYTALLRLIDPEWTLPQAILISAGALLFYLSDILNAWQRFITPFVNDRVQIMLTYHLGQIAIAVGAALHFAG